MSERRKVPRVSIGLLAGGVALGLSGFLYARGCDFDAMNDCRPLGLFTGDSFIVGATGGLILMGGAAVFLAGMLGLVMHSLRRRS